MNLSMAAWNHFLVQHPEQKALLLDYVGQTIEIRLAFIGIKGVITEQGLLASSEAEPAAKVLVSQSAIIAKTFGQEVAHDQVDLQGDMVLASCVAKVLEALRFDLGENLSHIVGDRMAHKIERFWQQSKSTQSEVRQRVVSSLLEYQQHEAKILVTKNELTNFVNEVDHLRSDADRLTKRLNRIEQNILAAQEKE